MNGSMPHRDPEKDAFERGRRQAQVDNELESHDRRLNAINGSMEKAAQTVMALERTIEDVRDKLEELAATLNTRAAIEADRVKQIRTANEKQITNRTFWLGVAAIVAALIAAVFSSNGGPFG